MDGRLLPVLLLLLCAGPWGQGQEPEGPSEVLPEESTGEEDDGILVLSHNTLSQALQEHPALMVEFCECFSQWFGDLGGLGVQASTS